MYVKGSLTAKIIVLSLCDRFRPDFSRAAQYRCGCPLNDPLTDSRTTAEPGRRKRRRASRKPARPPAATSARRASGGRTAKSGGRSGAGRRPAGEAEEGRHRQADFAPKSRHARATSPLDAGAERAGIEAPLGHESIATTRIHANVGQERMEQAVGRVQAHSKRQDLTTALQSLPLFYFFNQLPIKLAHILGHLARRFRLRGAVEASALPVCRPGSRGCD